MLRLAQARAPGLLRYVPRHIHRKSRQAIAMTREGHCEIEALSGIKTIDALWWIKLHANPTFLEA
jgi:hypothetical protein